MAHYKDLIVWQKSIDFVSEIYKITETFPATEIYGLSSQLRRAAGSVPSNIAEGNLRRSLPDYLLFLKIAGGSCAEIETQLIIAKNLNFMEYEQFQNISESIKEILKMLNGLINSLNKTNT